MQETASVEDRLTRLESRVLELEDLLEIQALRFRYHVAINEHQSPQFERRSGDHGSRLAGF